MNKYINFAKFIPLVILLCSLLGLSTALQAERFDVVINSGRVIDPETGLDDIRNIGISAGVISAITTKIGELDENIY